MLLTKRISYLSLILTQKHHRIRVNELVNLDKHYTKTKTQYPALTNNLDSNIRKSLVTQETWNTAADGVRVFFSDKPCVFRKFEQFRTEKHINFCEDKRYHSYDRLVIPTH